MLIHMFHPLNLKQSHQVVLLKIYQKIQVKSLSHSCFLSNFIIFTFLIKLNSAVDFEGAGARQLGEAVIPTAIRR